MVGCPGKESSVKPERVGEPDVDGGLAGYPLLDALRGRRSRRFGMGMKIPEGPFAYESRHEPCFYRPEALFDTQRRHADH
jgi:hypothetical protein